STLRILRTYVRVIRAFAALDGRGVLLERVARGIRRYLREREDCIGIVVRGLLADVSEEETGAVDDWREEEEEGPGVLTELAAELGKARQEARAKGGGVGSVLDWDDMSWMPDPIDAPPEPSGNAGGNGTGTAKSPTDVIGSLLSLFESRDMVVSELQRVLSARLLRGKYTPKDETEAKEKDYEKEESVLELLKTRFGEAALQPCEVMLRDVFDSRLTDKAVHVWQAHTRKKEGRKLDQDQPSIDLHARMLSHMYWPPSSKLPSSSSLAAAAVMGTASGSQNAASEFKLPEPVQSAQKAYADTFAHLKRSRTSGPRLAQESALLREVGGQR
ncbi:Anaphase-promoting complex subunit 2, partial [Ascosphaera atra]